MLGLETLPIAAHCINVGLHQCRHALPSRQHVVGEASQVGWWWKRHMLQADVPRTNRLWNDYAWPMFTLCYTDEESVVPCILKACPCFFLQGPYLKIRPVNFTITTWRFVNTEQVKSSLCWSSRGALSRVSIELLFIGGLARLGAQYICIDSELWCSHKV